jgi:D-3-phosphoglycerate dehydrogenase
LQGHDVTVYQDTEKDAERLAERLKDAEAVVLTQQRSRFPRALIERLPNLKLICQTGRNAAHIDMEACTEKGITVCGGGGGSPSATAELAWGLIIAALRNLPYEAARLKAGHWQSTAGTQLEGKTLGIYAYGNIGSRVARVGGAFGMKVQCWGRGASLDRARQAGFEAAASREAFFESSDVISVHLPLNPETRGLITGADLARMKPTALFVNTSRAPIVAAGALATALGQGRPGLAAVDVFEDEPVLGGDHPLLKTERALCTPHLGYVVKETYEGFYNKMIDNLLAYAQGSPANVLNPQASAGGKGQ